MGREFTKYARRGLESTRALIGGYVDIIEGGEVRADLIGAAVLAKDPTRLGPDIDIDMARQLFPELDEPVRIPASIYRKQAKRIEQALANDPVLRLDRLYEESKGGYNAYLEGPMWRVVTALNDEAQVSRSNIVTYLERAGY
jgi:hypothetical protein